MKHLWDLAVSRIRSINPLFIPFIFISVFFIITPTLIIFYYAFFSSANVSLQEHISSIDESLFFMFLRSFYIAIITVVFCILFAYPLAYFINAHKSNLIKGIMVTLITLPLWTNYFIKLIGLKCMFDYWNGYSNSTFGMFYSILGLTYIFLPLSCLTIFNTLNNMPKSLILSSMDLGCNEFETVLKITLPYTKTSLYAVIFLVFLPSLFSVAASEFLNNQNSSKMIGEYLNSMMFTAFNNEKSKSNISFIVIFIGLLTVFFYLMFQHLPKIFLKKHSIVLDREIN